LPIAIAIKPLVCKVRATATRTVCYLFMSLAWRSEWRNEWLWRYHWRHLLDVLLLRSLSSSFLRVFLSFSLPVFLLWRCVLWLWLMQLIT